MPQLPSPTHRRFPAGGAMLPAAPGGLAQGSGGPGKPVSIVTPLPRSRRSQGGRSGARGI